MSGDMAGNICLSLLWLANVLKDVLSNVWRALRTGDLAPRYHAIVLAYGAEGDKELGIPGEDLPVGLGTSCGATPSTT